MVRLKERVARNDRSLQAEIQTIIERAAKTDVIEGRVLAARIRRKLNGSQALGCHRSHRRRSVAIKQLVVDASVAVKWFVPEIHSAAVPT